MTDEQVREWNEEEVLLNNVRVHAIAVLPSLVRQYPDDTVGFHVARAFEYGFALEAEYRFHEAAIQARFETEPPT